MLTDKGLNQATTCGNVLAEEITRLAKGQEFKIKVVSSPFVRTLQTCYCIINELASISKVDQMSPFEIDYLLSEWQAAYLYPNKSDSKSPIEHLLIRNLPREQLVRNYLT